MQNGIEDYEKKQHYRNRREKEFDYFEKAFGGIFHFRKGVYYHTRTAYVKQKRRNGFPVRRLRLFGFDKAKTARHKQKHSKYVYKNSISSHNIPHSSKIIAFYRNGVNQKALISHIFA